MNPTVVVTGASTGIGRACALYLDRHGFNVFATVRRGADGAALAMQTSERIRPLYLDVTDEASIREAAAEVKAAVGEAGLQGLVNNAGVAEPGPLEYLPLDRLRRQLEVNVTGQVAVTQAFLPLLRRARGRIVNVGSIGGRNVLPFAGAYCASKYALEAVADALRMELRPAGVEVVVVEPGGVATSIWDKALGEEPPPDVEAFYGRALRAMKAAVDRISTEGVPAEAVAKVVHAALTARRPRTRYLVGHMAYVRLLLQKLPDRLRDRILIRQFTGS